MTKGNLNDLIRTEANKEVESQPSPSPKRPKETNATLQAKINDLTAELEKTEKNQQTLQEKVISLEKELKEQQQTEQLESVLSEKTTLVTQLSSQLSQSQTELTDKKQLIEKLSSQLSQSQTELTDKKLYNQIQTLENSPTPTPEPSAITKPVPKKPSLYNFEMANLARYIAPNPTPTELTDSDIGWFD
ncbi:MAG: hypothetical protein GPJ13_07580 [Microcystis aeruginosa W11-06]|nr:hypothetical protein [Microcystis aeruginosa W11-06]